MKMRKLFAGLAAAATLLGGLAISATTANAANGDAVTDNATFTFTAETAEQLTGRSVTAYKIGEYVQYGTGDNAAYAVQTVAGNAEAVKTALEAAGQTDVTADYLANALAAGFLDKSGTRAWTDGTTRKFANNLAVATLTGGEPVTLSDAAPVDGGTGDGAYSATVDLPAGIYLFVDNTAATGEITKAVPMVVASGTVTNGAITSPTAGATVNFKNSKNTDKTKIADKNSVSVGDTIEYTLTGKVANPAPASFEFTDRPGTGLTVAANIAFTVTADGTAVPADDYTVTGLDSELVGDGTKTFAVSIKADKLADYAGKTIVVKYSATVNSAAANQYQVVNELQGNDGTYKQTTVSLFEFSIHKTDAAGNALEGAGFTLYNEDGTAAIQRDGKDYVLSTDANGDLTFSGLAAGTYTVKETSVPTGYLQNKPEFKVTIAENGGVTLAQGDVWGLVTLNDKTFTVKNVKSITQLPLTGAAGTALFAVVALLLAGAGVTVFTKSRGTKRALNA